MPLPSNFAALALHSSIKDGDGFLFITTGASGYLNMMIQGATGAAIPLLNVTSGYTTSNSLWVDGTYGSDTYGQRGRGDYPYKTLAAAKTGAIAGDTIYVWPGTYTGTNLLKDGVTYYFHDGATVYLTSGVDTAMFSTSGFAGSYEARILGYGTFNSVYGTGVNNHIIQSVSSARLFAEFNSIGSTELSGPPLIYHSGSQYVVLTASKHNSSLSSNGRTAIACSGGQIMAHNLNVSVQTATNAIHGEVYLDNCLSTNLSDSRFCYNFDTTNPLAPTFTEKTKDSVFKGIVSLRNTRTGAICFDNLYISGGLNVSGRTLVTNTMIYSNASFTRNGAVNVSGFFPAFANVYIDATSYANSFYAATTGSGVLYGAVITNKTGFNVGYKFNTPSYDATWKL